MKISCSFAGLFLVWSVLVGYSSWGLPASPAPGIDLIRHGRGIETEVLHKWMNAWGISVEVHVSEAPLVDGQQEIYHFSYQNQQLALSILSPYYDYEISRQQEASMSGHSMVFIAKATRRINPLRLTSQVSPSGWLKLRVFDEPTNGFSVEAAKHCERHIEGMIFYDGQRHRLNEKLFEDSYLTPLMNLGIRVSGRANVKIKYRMRYGEARSCGALHGKVTEIRSFSS